MFSPVPPASPQDMKVGRIVQMMNEDGVLITREGLDRDGQWVMAYTHPFEKLQAVFWTYRREEHEPAWAESIGDFWTVRLGPEFWHCPKSLVDTASLHIAEALLSWPLFGRWNSFQAKSVRILRPMHETEVERVITLLEAGVAGHVAGS